MLLHMSPCLERKMLVKSVVFNSGIRYKFLKLANIFSQRLDLNLRPWPIGLQVHPLNLNIHGHQFKVHIFKHLMLGFGGRAGWQKNTSKLHTFSETKKLHLFQSNVVRNAGRLIIGGGGGIYIFVLTDCENNQFRKKSIGQNTYNYMNMSVPSYRSPTSLNVVKDLALTVYPYIYL